MVLKKEPPDEKMKEEMTEFIEVFISLLRGIGAYVETMGKIEKKHPDVFKTMAEMTSSPEVLESFVSSAPPEVVGSLLKIMLRTSSLGSKMGKAMTDLSAEEKIELGKEFKQLADDLHDLLKKVEE